jgi:hypothetical protein
LTDFAKLLQTLSEQRVDFEKLIEVKRAAGRIRDLQAVADLQALLNERRKQS